MTEDDPADLDEQRAAALAAFYDFPQLQIDQCPYESEHYGLCQLVFLLFPSSHSLKLLLFQLQSDDGSEHVLKMNREVSLNFFKILTPLMANPADLFKHDEELTPLDEREKDRIKKEQAAKLERQRRDLVRQVLTVIRKIKARFSGNIYDDFYNFGSPCSTVMNDWAKLAIHLLSREKLVGLLNEKLMHRIQQKYF